MDKRFLLMQMNSELFELKKMGCRDLSGQLGDYLGYLGEWNIFSMKCFALYIFKYNFSKSSTGTILVFRQNYCKIFMNKKINTGLNNDNAL